jgi:hypothetical protein
MRRADTVRQSIWRRAQAACRAAGLSDYGHLHNAMVSRDMGRPWREVDYSKARLARRLFKAQEAAPRLVRDYIDRKGMRAFTWEG